MRKITIDDKIIQEIKELSANKEFMAEVEALRQRAIDSHLELGDSLLIDQAFDKEANELAKKYGVSKLGLSYFNGFVFVGGFNPFLKGMASAVSVNIVNDEFVNIQINRHTTLNDIKADWPRIQTYFKNGTAKRKRFKLRKNIDRDLEILNLKNKGLTSQKIIEEINGKYGCDLSHDYISKLLARLKSRTHENS